MNLKGDASLTRKEIEAKLNSVGDYVKMDYLADCLKKSVDFDTKKFVLTKLSSIYESRKMFAEAAKLMRTSADINTTFEGKMNDFMKSVDLFIKGGNYDDADASFNKALVLGNQRQKDDIKLKRKELYKAQAKDLFKKDKRKHAMDIYEKLLTLDLTPAERDEVNKTLSGLYEKLGKVKEFYGLKKSQEKGFTPPTPPRERPEPAGPSADELLFEY